MVMLVVEQDEYDKVIGVLQVDGTVLYDDACTTMSGLLLDI